MLTSKQIRKLWLDFFESKQHLVVESKSLIPVNDPSLLWINSGVATLKDFFSGKKTPPHPRITNSQKSIRTNDIENVGITTRHHTFFEMLGNFSIGDYFKPEAIEFAYEFIFGVLKFPKEKIYITYYEEDLDTFNKWTSLGIEPSHMVKGTRDTNFWDVGQGPCGPDTEIFYDRGPKYDSRGLELIKDDIENDRFIEIWNIVFSQFNNDGENNYTELKYKNIDTGAGLERICSIIQDVPTNFDTDLFQTIIHEIEKYTDYRYDINNYFTKEKTQQDINTQFKIIADHMRASVNAINDGVKPSNVGRGYIIRRLIRRSYRSGLKLKIQGKAFLYKLVQSVKDSLIYDIDVKNVEKIIKDEELLFSKTINQGEKLLEKEIEKNGSISTDIAFKMFDTYGFPIELTSEILAEKNIKIDINEFNQYLEQHRQKSRSQVASGMEKVISSLDLVEGLISTFTGYEETTHKGSKILYLLNDYEEIEQSDSDDDYSYVILDKTPFYATSGGQFHDYGKMIQNDNEIEIIDVFKDKHWNHIHKVKGKIQKDALVDCYVDQPKREGYMRGHSSTHILFSALREIFKGEKIEQLGSSIMPEYFTFDFPADKKPSKEQIKLIEEKMHQYIKMDVNREYKIMSVKEAEDFGAYMTIEESDYHDQNAVRVVVFDGITKDLCGGTHVEHTGFIEDFKIVSVESKGTGIYRLRVVTSNKLVSQYFDEEISKQVELLNTLITKNQSLNESYVFNIAKNNAKNNIEKEQYLDELNENEQQLREDFKELYKQKQNQSLDLNHIEIKNINSKDYILVSIDDMSQTKKVAVELREKFASALVVAYTISEGKVFVVVASKTYPSNVILKTVLEKYNGKGGGNAIVSQGSFALENDQDLQNYFLEVIKNA
ncbi:alanine--tRNA ligase [[Mycoplasma] gypis]|uniref:Alanine--tRNA ligase n=1 Tax=[Mycoplasma] gypis TaxID=92404 RepID=A0ABZ2RNL9_9BACT|nr:alanine--tRNA ligase [[Mycoplasma] gypis]MBN0919463.1 alanine--tRNA ligase [[Mycoplasma] gypis]